MAGGRPGMSRKHLPGAIGGVVGRAGHPHRVGVERGGRTAGRPVPRRAATGDDVRRFCDALRDIALAEGDRGRCVYGRGGVGPEMAGQCGQFDGDRFGVDRRASEQAPAQCRERLLGAGDGVQQGRVRHGKAGTPGTLTAGRTVIAGAAPDPWSSGHRPAAAGTRHSFVTRFVTSHATDATPQHPPPSRNASRF
jgi:hypothetical protein